MARLKRSYVCCYFSSTNSQNAVLDVYGKKERSCGNTRKLVKHLRLNHNTGYEAFRMRRSEEESRASGAAVGPRQTSLAESFGTAGRHYPDDSTRAATFTRCLGEMIVKDLQHLSTVEDQGFQGLVRAKI